MDRDILIKLSQEAYPGSCPHSAYGSHLQNHLAQRASNLHSAVGKHFTTIPPLPTFLQDAVSPSPVLAGCATKKERDGVFLVFVIFGARSTGSNATASAVTKMGGASGGVFPKARLDVAMGC